MTDAQRELTAALKDEASLERWLGLRGYTPLMPAPPPWSKPGLKEARYFHAAKHPRAPILLCLWSGGWTERALRGSDLRARQRDANEYRRWLRGHGHEREAPALCLVACPEFLVTFALDDNPFSRRLRFTPQLLDRAGNPLEQHFARFRASTFETWAVATSPPADSFLAELDGEEEGETSWDWSKLFVGAKLDQDFVSFMAEERARIAKLLLLPERREALLRPLWRPLSSTFVDGLSKDVLPTIERMARERRLRSALFATIDTVLLRLVLYRYLEAQFGYQAPQDEQRGIALGTYDEVVAQTVRVDQKNLETRRGRGRRGAARQEQLLMFAQVHRAKEFDSEVRRRAEWYQQQAGGDLHQGAVAEAADVLQEHLIREQRDVFAGLISGTSTADYSFHYADLDARAFQQFYEDTISTDLHLSYDPATRRAQVEVVDFERNRKEQGAFYTDERLCNWLVKRTLGRRFEEWYRRLGRFLEEHARTPKGRLPAVRALLDELMGWRIIDPTCGGGIFLRAAFEALSGMREKVVMLLERLPEEARKELTADAPYHAFAEGAEVGEWEWHVLLHMLYGVDVDVKAINVASNLLTLSALTYKRNGICFPSFINTSLKPGNALINPLRPEQRPAFLARHGAALAKLIGLRQRLREPNQSRDAWRKLHEEAGSLTRGIVEAEVLRVYDELWEDRGKKLISRVMRVGVFLYEAEFPEVFFELKREGGEERAVLRQNPGFDVVLGNPPWEEPAAELKEFLPEFDADYLALSGPASKKREDELLKDPVILKRWNDRQESIEDYKALLSSGWYQHQRRKVRGKIPGAHTNLYKYATEMSWHLLREGGAAGLVLSSGLWNDLAASGLRRLLIDLSSLVEVCGFTNNEGLFPSVEPRVKFSATTFYRGGRADELKGIFMCRQFEALDDFDRISVSISADSIRQDSRDSYPVPEVRGDQHHAFERCLQKFPCLDDEPWHVDTYSREFNAGEQREYFEPRRPGYLPLLNGTQFNLFGVFFGELPEFWVNSKQGSGAGQFLQKKQEGRILDAIAAHIVAMEGKIKGGKREAALDWVEAQTGDREIPPDWVRLDWDGYRLAWRDLVRNDDRRTLIVSIVPRRVALADTAPYVRPFSLSIRGDRVVWELQYEMDELLYLTGCLSSFTGDGIVRPRVAGTHLKPNIFKALPVPPWKDTKEQRRVAELTARLTCLPATAERPWADYTDLAAAVGLTPARDGLLDPAARREAEVELNALVARLYGLGAKEFRFLMDTLFMTPKHKTVHAALRDEIAARL